MVTLKGVNFKYVKNMYLGNGASSQKRRTKTVHRSVPQGSKDSGQTRRRASRLPDQQTSKKRKRNQNYMQRSGTPSHNHENDDEDEVVAVDEAEFRKMTCSMRIKGSSAKKRRRYIENDSSEEMEVEETNETVSRNKTAGRPLTKEASSKKDVTAKSLSRKNVDCKTQNMYLGKQEYDRRSDCGLLNSFLQKGSSSAHKTSWGASNGALCPCYCSVSSDESSIDSSVGETDDSSSDSEKGNVKDSEGCIIEEDEPRNKHTDANQCEYLRMSRTTDKKKCPQTDNVVIHLSSSSSECGNRCSGDDVIEVTSSCSSDGVGSLSLYHEDNGVQKTYVSTEETNDYSKRDEHCIEHIQELFNEEDAAEQRNEADSAIVGRGHQMQFNEGSFAKQKAPLGKSRCIRASNKVLSEEEAEEHTEAVDNAVLEQGYQVQHNEEAFEKRIAPIRKLLPSRVPNEIQELSSEEEVKERKSGCSWAPRKENKTEAGENNKVPAEKNSTAANDATGEKGSSRVEGVDRSPSCTKRLIEAVHPVLSGRSGRIRASKEGKNNKVPAGKNITAAANDATGEKGSNRVDGVDRSPCMKTLIEAVHPVLSEDNDFNFNEDNDVQREVGSMTRLGVDGNGNSKRPTKVTKMCELLVNAIFGTGPRVEDVECNNEDNHVEAPPTDTRSTVPSKFRFEDERPEVVEKTEEEMARAMLFDELELAWQMGVPQASQTLNVDPEPECPVAEETQEDRCARGEHEYRTKDDEGQVCIYCSFVGLGPRDILPEWGGNSRRRPHKRPPYLADLPKFEEEPPNFEEVLLESLVKRDASFNISDDGTVWDIKPGVRECMYKHQQEGFEFLWRNLAGSINLSELKSSQPRQEGGCLVSHAPGTGKTRLTIIFLETYLKMFPRCQPLIIAPAGMLLTWQEEFVKWNFPFPFYNLNKASKFSGNESPFVLKQVTGDMQTRDTVRLGKAYSWNDNVSVLGISYHLFETLTKNKKDDSGKKRDDPLLKKILLEKPGLAVLDEGHYPRSDSSNIWNSFLQLKTEKRVVLSGTPFQNNLDELFNTMKLVRPAVTSVVNGEKTLAGISMSKMLKTGTKSDSESEVNCDDLEKLKSAISPFVSVHKGTILRDSLPGLKEVVIVVKPSSLQKTLIEKLKGLNSLEHQHTNALISAHPYLLGDCKAADIERLKVDPRTVEHLKLKPNEGAKTKFIFELLRHAMAADEKVLIFSQFIHPLELLMEQLKSCFNWVADRQILQMTGETVVSKRQYMINYFNNPHSEARVLLAATKCCNEGISLVGASRVVLLDVVWNPSVERQAIARAYRIGQKKLVYVYHLLTSGTNEGYKYYRQTEKSRLSDLLFSSSLSDEPAEMKSQAVDIEDRILDHVAGQLNLVDTFLKVMNQPTKADMVGILDE